MKYDLEKTQTHNLSLDFHCCLKNYNQIIQSEDDDLDDLPSIFDDNVVAIDLDCIERLRASQLRQDQVSTMDTVFAISDLDQTEMLLVELRLNYKNLYNLNRNKLIAKVEGSISLLGNSVPINENYIFIFQPNKKQEAINRIARMIPSLNSNYQVLDLNDLIRIYF